MAALQDLEAAGHTPKAGLLERCVARCAWLYSCCAMPRCAVLMLCHAALRCAHAVLCRTVLCCDASANIVSGITAAAWLHAVACAASRLPPAAGGPSPT